MTNAELIKALQCASHFALYQDCYEKNCYANSGKGLCCNIPKLMADAADELEAADKRIAELEAQLPKRGEWIEKWRFKADGTPFHKIGDMECGVCHGDMLGRYYSKYCPHCGALLRGEHDEQ